jgi:RNA polymerase sigma factor (sigma-70 family)
MTKAFVALRKEKRDFELLPWLFRIVHNEAITLVRQRRPTADLELADRIGEDSLTQSVSDRAALTQLKADLNDLGERQRAALVMRELSGLTHKEIAAALACSTVSAKQSIFEARSALSEMARGREMECELVQRALSDADGRVVRSRPIRSHLRDCEICAEFRAALKTRPRNLAAISPALPAVSAAAILSNVLAGGHAATSAAGAASGAAGAGTVVAGGVVGKSIAVVAATAVIAGGAITANKVATHKHKSPPSSPTTQTVVPGPAKAAAGLSAGSSDSSESSTKTSKTSRPDGSTAAGKAAQGKATAPGQLKKATGTIKAKGKAKAKAKAKVKAKGKATAPGRLKVKTTPAQARNDSSQGNFSTKP